MKKNFKNNKAYQIKMSDKDVITYQNIWEKVWSDLMWWNQAIVELWGHWKVHQFYTIFDTKIFLIVAGT